MTSRPTLGFSLAAMLLALVWSAPATAAPAVDAHAEIVAALFAASATQAATERAADASLTAERAEIEVLRKQVRAGQADDARLVAEEEQFVGELSAYYIVFRLGGDVPRFEEWERTIPGDHPRMREMVAHARAGGWPG